MDFCKKCGLVKEHCKCDTNSFNTELKMIRFYLTKNQLVTALIDKDKVKDRKGRYYLCKYCNIPLIYQNKKVYCPRCNNSYDIFKNFFQEGEKLKNIIPNKKINHIQDILTLKKGQVKPSKITDFQSNLFHYENSNFRN